MPQSSLMAWLNKPAAAKALPAEHVPHRRKEETRSPPASTAANPQHDYNAEDRNGAASVQRFAVQASPLPPQVELRACTEHDLPRLKRITSLLLPVPYPDAFYREITSDAITRSITLVAVWHGDTPAATEKARVQRPGAGKLIGAIRCRLLAHLPSPTSNAAPLTPPGQHNGPILYLSTLLLLSPYRSHGIASHMLDLVTRRAVQDYGVRAVGAHVWEANTEALDWYRKRGFREVGMEEGYYRRLKPQRAVVVERRVGVMDLVGG